MKRTLLRYFVFLNALIVQACRHDPGTREWSVDGTRALVQDDRADAPNHVTRPRITLAANRLILSDLNAGINIPGEWRQWYDKFHNNFYSGDAAQTEVRDACGDLDSSVASILNHVLPSDACRALVSSSAHGCSLGNAELQLWLYYVQEGVDLVESQIAIDSLRAIKAASSDSKRVPYWDLGLEGRRGRAWRRVCRLNYTISLGDSFGEPRIEFW